MRDALPAVHKLGRRLQVYIHQRALGALDAALGPGIVFYAPPQQNRRPTANGPGRLHPEKMKSGTLTIGDIIQPRSLEMLGAVRVEEGFDPVLHDHRIVRLRGPLKVQAVLEALAATTRDRHPNATVPEALQPHGVPDHLDRFGGKGEQRLGHLVDVDTLLHDSPFEHNPICKPLSCHRAGCQSSDGSVESLTSFGQCVLYTLQ